MKLDKPLISKLLSVVVLAILISIAAEAQTKTVEIKGSKYTPNNLTIKEGMTVSWVNKDSSKTHQVLETFNKFQRSPLLFPYDSYNLTFNELGKFEFRDAANPNKMIGHLTVVSEEDYVEEANATADQLLTNETEGNETGSSTESTISSEETAETSSQQSEDQTTEGSEAAEDSTQDTQEEDEASEHDENKSPKTWWIIAIIIVVAAGAFFAAKQFVQINPIEIREEIRKPGAPKISFKDRVEQPQKELKARILKIDGNILSIKCPKCGNVIKTVSGRHGTIDIACDNCRAHISADIK